MKKQILRKAKEIVNRAQNDENFHFDYANLLVRTGHSGTFF